METKIKKIMSIVFDAQVENLGGNPSPDTLEAWDSLNHMKLISSLEEEFGIQFDDDDILNMKDYHSVQSILSKHLEKI